MQEFFSILCECPMFKDVESPNLLGMLKCLGGEKREYKKGEVIFAEGSSAGLVGIVLKGNVQITRTDYYGNRSIVAEIGVPQLFGETFACADVRQLPVDVIAASDTVALLMDAKRIVNTCSNSCEFHRRIIFNLLKIVSQKNLKFHQKIEITSQRTTREKLMTYLMLQAKEKQSNTFEIPFDRQELADYLEVDRSGLSAEISKLRKEGILECEKNRFTLVGKGLV